MLFNSPLYVYLFLPVVVICYFAICRLRSYEVAKLWLVLASLFFYGAWNFHYVPLILISLFVNYTVAVAIASEKNKKIKIYFLWVGVVFNASLLFYYKYYNFFIKNIDFVFGGQSAIEEIVLPLGISFFTFQKIAYLVDTYRGAIQRNKAIDFCFFVTFFPQLISGPIVHHKDVIPQINNPCNKIIIWKNCVAGISLFFIGLFKKVIVADMLGSMVFKGHELEAYYFFCSWFISFAYTLQIYYDFSGYMDMALGSALLMNVRLPLNFNSPYKAKNITDFWRRWHITLSRWLREYIYIPLGGNRHGNTRTFLNVFVTFVIGGIWHGANWTFVAWGSLHGLLVVFHKMWSLTSLKMPAWIAGVLLLICVNVLWIFFRAESMGKAALMVSGLVNVRGGVKDVESLAWVVNQGLSETWMGFLCNESYTVVTVVLLTALLLLSCCFAKNSNEMVDRVLLRGDTASIKAIVCVVFVIIVSVFVFIYKNISQSPFIYFNF